MSHVSDLISCALLEAIRAERDGASFYLMAAQTCDDPLGKKVFQGLAAEELDHQEYLGAQHQSLQTTGRLDSSLKLQHQVDLAGDSPIFSPQIKDRIKDAHFEMSALSIGIQLEQSAIEHYSRAADAAEDPAVAEFFRELVRWETGHHQALLRQQELLKEDYWSSGGYCPF